MPIANLPFPAASSPPDPATAGPASLADPPGSSVGARRMRTPQRPARRCCPWRTTSAHRLDTAACATSTLWAATKVEAGPATPCL